MKNNGIFLAAFLLLAGIASSNAQDIDKNQVPAAVKSAFMKAYPKATDVDWEMKSNNYEADFDLAKVDYKATYTSAGKAISVEKDIPNSQLPALIVKNIKAKYPKGRIDDVDLINTGGKISYKVDIEGTPDVNVWYTADGKFVKELAD